jgi:hypothetical protein
MFFCTTRCITVCLIFNSLSIIVPSVKKSSFSHPILNPDLPIRWSVSPQARQKFCEDTSHGTKASSEKSYFAARKRLPIFYKNRSINSFFFWRDTGSKSPLSILTAPPSERTKALRWLKLIKYE